MPVVPYYQGRPAITWITAMSGPPRAAANPADGMSPASPQPAAPATAAKRPGGNQRPRGPLDQRLGGLGSQLVYPSGRA